MTAHIVAAPERVDDSLPITKAMHERIVADDGINPQSRTTRAILTAIAELEAALTNGQQDAG